MAINTQNNIGDIEIENAYIFSKNFKGVKRVNPRTNKVVNAEGTRGFCVRIDDVNIAQTMAADGWNVKINPSENPGEAPFCYLPVEARFNNFPPTIYMVSGGRAHELDVNHVHQLDDRRFSKVNLVIHPRRYQTDDGEWRIKAFLSEGWFYIEQSRFAEEWAAQQNNNYDEEVPF